MNRTSTYLVILNGVICGFFIINAFFLGHFFTGSRTVRSDVVQGILIGFALAFVTAQALRKGQGQEDQRLDHHVRIR